MTELKVPAVAESITEVTLSRFLVKDGDYVEMDQPVCELETDKASQEIPAPVAGVVKLVAKEGDDLKIGALICNIDESAAKPASSQKEEKPVVEEKKKEKVEEQPKAESSKPKAEKEEKTSYAANTPSPAAKKILDEGNVSNKNVKGTGVGGRITKQDALDAVKNKLTGGKEAFSRNERVEKMSRLRKTVSDRLVYSKNSTAMLTTFNEVDMSAINKIRDKYSKAFKEKYEVNLGLMSFFAKACCLALEQFPAVNAYIEDGNIIYHDYCDISIAV
ncbi:MAG TPA: 2-oxo acid dehydrogenase subunit E2, partial [Chitinophagales bacterium]|nr:2-oxo acid dehydrogenase subunit E2 [Chitinophagales bacterium]